MKIFTPIIGVILPLLMGAGSFANTPPIIYQFVAPLQKAGDNRTISINANSVLPSQVSHNGEGLFTNGTSPFWAPASGSGTVTNITSGDSSLEITNPMTTPDIRLHWPLTAGVAGTAAAPAITWGGSGIFQSSYGLLNFETSGIERLRFENNANAEFFPGDTGTVTVNGNVTSTGTYFAGEGGGSTGYMFTESGNDTGMYSPSDGDLRFESNGQYAMQVSGQDVHVQGNISAANYPPTGSANTIATFDGSNNLAASSALGINSLGGLNTTFNINVDNTGGSQLHDWNQNFVPSVNSNDNWLVHNLNTQIDMSGGFNWSPTATALTQINQGITATGSGSLGGINFHQANVTLGDGTNPSSLYGVNYYLAFANIQAGSTVANYMNGYGFQPTFQVGSAIGAGAFINAFYDGANIAVPSYGYNSFSSNPNLFQVSNNYNYNGFTSNPTIATIEGNAGVYGFGFYPQIITQGANGNVVALNANPTITTMGASGNMQGVSLGGHVITSHGNIGGYQFYPQIDGGDANITGLQISPHGTAVLPQVKGVEIDLSQIGIAADQQKLGLSVNDGAVNIASNIDTSKFMPSGEWQHNLIGGLFHIAAGHPITNGSFGFGNNMGPGVFFEDDMGPDNTGIGIGYSVNGLAGLLSGASGKTMNTLNYMLIGAGIDASSTGGTVTNLNLVNALGLLPEGGTLNVTNLVAFRGSPILCLVANNCWGVKIDSAGADNWFAKDVIIGGSTGKPTQVDNALDVIGNAQFSSTLQLPVQASGTTPTCAAVTDDGKLALTNTHILCGCNGNTPGWFQASDGTTACTF